MSHNFETLLLKSELSTLLEQHSFLDDSSFWVGIKQRFSGLLFSELYESDDIIKYINDELIENLAKLDAFKLNSDEVRLLNTKLLQSIISLSAKIVGYGTDRRFKSKFNKVQDDQGIFFQLYEATNRLDLDNKGSFEHLLLSVNRMNDALQNFRKSKHIIGTTRQLTYATARINFKLLQIRYIIQLILSEHDTGQWATFLNNFRLNDRKKNSIRTYIKEHFELLALVTVENTAKSGVQYIGNTRKEVSKLFRKSLIGGGVIALFALFKILFSSFEVSNGVYAFFSSMNYAICFILVSKLGGSIATKQSALTASTIVKGIDPDNDLVIDKKSDVINMIRHTNVSQFASFAGNLLIAFPLSFLIALLFSQIVGVDLASMYKSDLLVDKNSIATSNIILYSSMAGVFLAIAGLCSGYLDNKLIVIRLRERMFNNRIIVRLFGSKRIGVISNYLYKNTGKYSGNILLGFLLGGIEYISSYTPLHLEIRHIAFSSANLGYALLSTSHSMNTILIAGVSIFLIGFVNFTVSFSITFYIALLSRQVAYRDISNLITSVTGSFFNNPKRFFILEK